jgi:hypothetical protein
MTQHKRNGKTQRDNLEILSSFSVSKLSTAVSKMSAFPTNDMLQKKLQMKFIFMDDIQKLDIGYSKYL